MKEQKSTILSVNIGQEMVWLYRFPPYSPELNPDEQVWHHFKNIALKNQTCRTKEELKKHLTKSFGCP
jgi:transposase